MARRPPSRLASRYWDSKIRNQTTVAHPAPFSQELYPVFLRFLQNFGLSNDVLDPFAGIGGIHWLRSHGYDTIGVEIEPEWAFQSPYTILGDATALPFADDSIGNIVTSPCYGNRMADSHDARDSSYRRTYTHVMGRKLHKNNTGAMQWGTQYKIFHKKAWEEAVRVLRPLGLLIVNVKDHQRGFKRMHVANWHHQTLESLGLYLITVERVSTPGYRRGENWQYRYPERVLVYRNYPDDHPIHWT